MPAVASVYDVIIIAQVARASAASAREFLAHLTPTDSSRANSGEKRVKRSLIRRHVSAAPLPSFLVIQSNDGQINFFLMEMLYLKILSKKYRFFFTKFNRRRIIYI